jgi:hypothetical protein
LVNPQRAGTSAKVLLLGLVSEHLKGNIDPDAKVGAIVGRRNRCHPADRAQCIREAVEVAVSCIGQFDYEARGASCLVAGEYLGLAKLHLMTEQGNRVDRKGQGKHAQG